MVRRRPGRPRSFCVFGADVPPGREWESWVLLWEIWVLLRVDFGLFPVLALYWEPKKLYDDGKDSTRNSGSRQRACGSGGGLCESGAVHPAERARHHTQSAHGGAAGGTCGVRRRVAAGPRHAGGPGCGAGRSGRPGGDERPQPLHQPQPRLLRSRGGGLQPSAGGRGRVGGGRLRRGEADGVEAGGGFRTRSRRYRLCVPLRLCAAPWRGGALDAGAALRGACGVAVAAAVGRGGGASLRLRVGPRGGGVAERVAGAARTGSR